MGSSPSVLLLDDGELDDIHRMLDELGIPCARVRGGAIVKGTPPPRDLLVATPRRIEAVREAVAGSDDPPVRVMVVNEDSNALRDQLRRSGFDYLVRRPVHSEALRLLLLHCVYKGEERRREPRVAVGFDVSFRSGLLTRRATLADLSIRGCRLLSRTRVETGRRVRVQIPEALETGEPFSVTGRVVRAEEVPHREDESFSLGVAFDGMDDDARQALEIIIEDRARGPATLRRGAEAVPRPPEPATESAAPSASAPEGPPSASPDARGRDALDVELGLEPEPESESARPPQGGLDDEDTAELGPPPKSPESADDRRRVRRAAYAQTVPAFGNRALRVLVGRDLSVGGMRIERLNGVELGDRLHLALYGEPGEKPLLVWGTVSRDDGDTGVAIVFDRVDPTAARRLERLVGTLPAVESLHDSEVEAMGTVVSEIVP